MRAQRRVTSGIGVRVETHQCLSIVITVLLVLGLLFPVPVFSSATRVAVAEAVPGFVVTSTGDEEDATSQDNACLTESGTCTLRAAIQEANRQPGPNIIRFAIPGNGPHTIQLTSSLPWLSDQTGPTTLDGYSQSGATPNTDPAISNATIMVQIAGPRSVDGPRSIDGLIVASAGNEVRGLAFIRLKRSIWIRDAMAHDNIIAGNFVGVGADGQPWYDQINVVERKGGDRGAFGIWLSGGASDNRIGGVTPADRNVISGNANDGIGMRGNGVSGNTILGNIIGLSPDGTRRVSNWGDGIDLNYGVTRTRIGGTQPGERNVISGNRGEGIEISHGTTTMRNQVSGNYIGTSIDGRGQGRRDFRNTGFGISLEDDIRDNVIGPGNIISNNGKGGVEIYGENNLGNRVTGNVIGQDVDGMPLPNRGPGIRVRYHATGTHIGPDNTVAHNEGPGILIIDGDVRLTTITRNTIFANAGGGIAVSEVSTEGSRTTSRAIDTRPDAPSISLADPRTVRGTACPGCTVEVFVADAGSDRAGQGKVFAGSGIASTSGKFVVRVSPLPAGSHVTATTTTPLGTTSVFSTNAAVAPGQTLVPVPVYPHVGLLQR